MTDVFFLCVFSLQKSFSLVLEALDHDNDTSESGEAAVCLFSYNVSDVGMSNKKSLSKVIIH